MLVTLALVCGYFEFRLTWARFFVDRVAELLLRGIWTEHSRAVKHQQERVSQMPEFWVKVYFAALSEEQLRVRVRLRFCLLFVFPG